jgi:hypothetical protein
MKDGDSKVEQYLVSGQANINGWKVGSLFGDAAFYNGDWLKRAAAAKGGIYGNDAVEAMYPMTKRLANGEELRNFGERGQVTNMDRRLRLRPGRHRQEAIASLGQPV